MSGVIEPIYVAQTAEPMTEQEQRQWMDARSAEAKARGVVHGRWSLNKTPWVLLLEGWDRRVTPEEEGPARFALQASP